MLTAALRRVLRDSRPVDRRTYITAGATLVAVNSLNMAPAIYWNSIADVILHRIHDRVLLHVKARAEEVQS